MYAKINAKFLCWKFARTSCWNYWGMAFFGFQLQLCTVLRVLKYNSVPVPPAMIKRMEPQSWWGMIPHRKKVDIDFKCVKAKSSLFVLLADRTAFHCTSIHSQVSMWNDFQTWPQQRAYLAETIRWCPQWAQPLMICTVVVEHVWTE